MDSLGTAAPAPVKRPPLRERSRGAAVDALFAATTRAFAFLVFILLLAILAGWLK